MKMISELVMTKPLDTLPAFQALSSAKSVVPELKAMLTPERIQRALVKQGDLHYLYGCTTVNDTVLPLLQTLADQAAVIPKYQALLNGEKVNITESVSVGHHQARSSKDRGAFGDVQAQVDAFIKAVHRGQIVTPSGRPYKAIIGIGIGGSYIGPRMMVEALGYCCEAKMQHFFLSNVDPLCLNDCLERVDLNEALIVLISKSGRTQEMLANYEGLKAAYLKQGGTEADFYKQVVSISQQDTYLDNPDYLERFYLDKSIGGRYSLTSIVGGIVIGLVYDPAVFQEILQGASLIDDAALTPDIHENACLLAALISIWHRNIHGYHSRVIAPYSRALRYFPNHLLQLSCESNGKRVAADGAPLNYPTCPVMMGYEGTDIQHSFFQMIHQGSDVTPVEFLGFQGCTNGQKASQKAHQKLMANLMAQMVALSQGKEDHNPHKVFPGNRPSTLLMAQKLTPNALGQLLAFYENVTMFEGFLWGNNSFDQEGVELGKVLARDLLEDTLQNPVLAALNQTVSSL